MIKKNKIQKGSSGTDSSTGEAERGILGHDVLLALFLSLFILTLIGVGNVLIVGMLGLLLCLLGMMQKSAKVDLWVFIPFILYLLAGHISACKAYGGQAQGYEAMQLVYLAVYLLLASLEKKEQSSLKGLCVLWTAIVAVTGIASFAVRAVEGNSARLGWLLGNPNSLGIFLVLGWLALNGTDFRGKENHKLVLLQRMEPFLLIAITLTLSMESFLSMAVGILVLLAEKKRRASFRETCFYACHILAKPVFGVGVGLLIYLSADRTNVPWFCVPLLVYALLAAVYWKKFEAFLEEKPGMAAAIAAMGLLVAMTAILLRPNAVATFQERLAMMRNGLGYIRQAPLFGVGPYQWRILNLYDNDKYFNTWFIHNSFIHVGAETGIIAVAMLLIISARIFQKNGAAGGNAIFAAFLFHNMMDTSFFYVGITMLLLLLEGTSSKNKRVIGGVGLRFIFGAFAAYFLFTLYRYQLLA